MGVRDLNKTLIISDVTNGQIIATIDLALYEESTILIMLLDILKSDFEIEHGLLIKHGFKP